MILVQEFKKTFIALLISLMLIPLFSINAYATVDTTTVDTITGQITETTSDEDNLIVDGDSALPSVGMQDVMNLVETKTFDVVYLFKAFGKPFAILTFVASACLSLLGVILKGGYVGKGLIGMFISGMVYVAIIYAPEIVQFFNTWLVR